MNLQDSYSLIRDDGFTVAALDRQRLFARVGVWCLYCEGRALWRSEKKTLSRELNEGLGPIQHDPIYGHGALCDRKKSLYYRSCEKG